MLHSSQEHADIANEAVLRFCNELLDIVLDNPYDYDRVLYDMHMRVVERKLLIQQNK